MDVATGNQSYGLPRVLVVQNGARHHYAIPSVLDKAGMLEAFYTDAIANVGLGRLLSYGRSLPVVGRSLKRLASRQISLSVAKKTVSFTASSALDAMFHQDFVGKQMIRRGFGNAAVVYSSLGWGRAFLKEAKRSGIPVIVEMYVRPSIWKTYQSEFRAFPGWEATLPLTKCEGLIASDRDPCLVADYLIVPSEGVREDVEAEHGFNMDRIMVLPYGVAGDFFRIQNHPIRGRVLFAGNCCLGKGIHYLAIASQQLIEKHGASAFEFRAAGHASDLVRGQQACRQLRFLGRVPRNEMHLEYESADVFVLPSLSEGSALVTYEALAAGLPVITTPEAGSVVRDGIDGRIVPSRNSDALANAIAEIVEDRDKRDRMAHAARERACQFTWERYGERLVTALRGLAG